MAAPVTGNGSLTCAHGGTLSLTAAGKLTAGGEGNPVQVFSSAGYQGSYTGCANPTNSGGPCTSTVPLPAEANPVSATRLTIGGSPALLSSLTANTLPAGAPVGVPLQNITPGQTKLTAS